MTVLKLRKNLIKVGALGNQDSLRILFAVSEAAPFAKVGGLADIAWSLPRALISLGHDVRVIMPKYGTIDEKKYNITMVQEGLVIHTAKKDIIYNIKQTQAPGNIIVYLIENQEYYEQRENVYGYTDDQRRFFLFGKTVIALIENGIWDPQIIHTHDWMTALIPNELRTKYKKNQNLNKIATVHTIHNIAHQGGQYTDKDAPETHKDDGKRSLPDLLDQELFDINFLKRGIIYADIVNTVSENYAKEIMTAEYGCGLDKLLCELRAKVFGVLNGIDYEVFNPTKDEDIWINYDRSSLDHKVKNKLAFQKEFDLAVNPNIPMIGFIARFAWQKGIELLMESLENLLNEINFQFVMVGGGDPRYEDYFRKLIEKFPSRVGGHLMISRIVGQKIYSAADMLIHPSRFEPCGLAPMIAMRYGTIPIVFKTGGLADFIRNYDPTTQTGNGFVFEHYNAMSSSIAVVRAIENYSDQKRWQKLAYKVMAEDFSWEASAKRYEELYQKALSRHKRWMKQEGLIEAETPEDVPGELTIDRLR